jgi:hypothetical protein
VNAEAAVCTVATLIGIAPWLLWVATHNDALPPLIRGAYGSYTAWLAAGWHTWGIQLLAVTLPDNVATIGMTVVRSIVPKGSAALDLLVGGTFALLTAMGVAVTWRRMRVTTLFVAGYLAIVLVWPFSPLIASDAEAAVYLYTGRRTVPVATFTAAEYVRERTVAEETAVMSNLLESYRPRYVLVTSPKLVEATARLAKQTPASLARVDSLDRGVVYSFRK